MGYGKDDDAFPIGPIDDGKREAVDEHAPSPLRGRRAGERKGNGTRDGFFNSGHEARAQARLPGVVVGNF